MYQIRFRLHYERINYLLSEVKILVRKKFDKRFSTKLFLEIRRNKWSDVELIVH